MSSVIASDLKVKVMASVQVSSAVWWQLLLIMICKLFSGGIRI